MEKTNDQELTVHLLEDYTSFLQSKNVHFVHEGHYLQVGNLLEQEGWILELSIIRKQLVEWLEAVVRVLVEANICFKIPASYAIACALIQGRRGVEELGKLVIVYPATTEDCVGVAKMLVLLTSHFRSPQIRSASWLGGTVYTRYDLFRSKKEPAIPFCMPMGVAWPFGELAAPILYHPKEILHNAYRPIVLIRESMKGDVMKATYYKSIFNMGHCFIKQARRDLFVDEWGRDTRDRLRWQCVLQQKLAVVVRIPSMIDYFEWRGDDYLVMQLLKGEVLTKVIFAVSGPLAWRDMNRQHKIMLLNYLEEVLEQIQRLHEKGIVHRDITPENFLVTQKGIYLFDLELAYDIYNCQPSPPFGGGTPGYEEPTRQYNVTPVVADDIYGIGALMINFFVNVSPASLAGKSSSSLTDCICYFTGSEEIAHLIVACFSAATSPALPEILSVVRGYRENIVKNTYKDVLLPTIPPINSLLENGMKFLNRPGENAERLLWAYVLKASVFEDDIHVVSLDLKDGIAGVLYLLAAVKKADRKDIIGCIIDSCDSNVKYLEKHCLTFISSVKGGLYKGSYGIAMALATCIKSQVLPDTAEYREYIAACLNFPFTGVDMAVGAAGYGLAILHCRDFIEPGEADRRLQEIINMLIEKQQPDGSWMICDENGHIRPGFSQGVSGVAWFLWQYSIADNNAKVINAMDAAMAWLVGYIQSCKKNDNGKFVAADWLSASWGNGIMGVVAVFLSAYKATSDYRYRIVAESALQGLLPYIHAGSLDYDSGSAGLGDIYLEAWKLFENEEYKRRADDIAGKIMQLSITYTDDSCYWATSYGGISGSSLLTGHSGMLYFLLRYAYPDRIPPLFQLV